MFEISLFNSNLVFRPQSPEGAVEVLLLHIESTLFTQQKPPSWSWVKIT